MLWDINQSVFLFFFRLAHQSATGDWIIIFFASILPFLLGGGLLAHIARLKDHHTRMRELAFVFGPAVVAYLIAESIKWFYPFPRPFSYAASIAPLIQEPDAFGSFPSSHTIFFAALGYALFLHERKWGEWYLVGAVLIGIARIAAGVHWPLDVFVGFVLGLLIAQMSFELERRIKTLLPSSRR